MDRMIGENALLGGEKSSHFYFAELIKREKFE